MTKHETFLKKVGFKEIDVHMGLFDYKVIVAIGKYENLEKYVQYRQDEKDFNLLEANRGYEPRGMYFGKVGYCPILWIPRYPRTRDEHGH